jgi:Uma2 family endonuclease
VNPLPKIEPVEDLEAGEDAYRYGWRERREIAPDGTEKLCWDPLTYQDLLDPQEGDVIAEDTVHRSVTEDMARILKRRYERDPTVAVWCNLKILFRIPGVTTGPGPDICLVEGVWDRDLLRTSFRFGEEPGKVRLVVEVVSEATLQKDYHDLLAVYGPLGVEEYVAVWPVGLYPQGPFELRGWRRDPASGRLRAIRPEPDGRLRSRVTGLLFGTGEDGWGLELWDAATGKRLTSAEDSAKARALRAANRADEAEERADKAERRNRELQAEIERLKARMKEHA